jgi:DNA-binding XRE family transcriptional regulator
MTHIQSEFSSKLIELRRRLGVNQTELGKTLGASAMAVSRWERGHVPSAKVLIQLGILAQKGDCWFFWSLAGLTSHDIMQVMPVAQKRLAIQIPLLNFVRAGAPQKRAVDAALVAIPLLPLTAAATREKGSAQIDLDSTTPEAVLAAPSRWCPNPSHTVCLRVKGNSMEPLLHDGYIIVVDRKQHQAKELEGSVIVAHNQKFGLVVSRFFRFGGSRMLVPDNRVHDAVPLNAGWRIVGKVLWWMGSPAEEQRS